MSIEISGTVKLGEKTRVGISSDSRKVESGWLRDWKQGMKFFLGSHFSFGALDGQVGDRIAAAAGCRPRTGVGRHSRIDPVMGPFADSSSYFGKQVQFYQLVLG